MKDNKKQPSIKLNLLYMMAYRVMVTIAPLVTTPYIARVLNPDDIGNYSYTQSVVAYFALIGALGCGIYGQREVAAVRDDKNAATVVFWETMLIRIAGALVTFIALLFSIFKLFSPELRVYYIILCIEMFGAVLDISWFYQGIENFASIFKRNFVLRLTCIVLIFAFVRTEKDIYVYVCINTIAQLLANATLWMGLGKRLAKIRLKDLSPASRFMPILLLFIPTIAATIYNRVDITMLGAITKNPTENANYYQVTKICTISITTIGVISDVILPRLAYTIKNGDKEQVNYYMSRALQAIVIVGLPISIGLMCTAKILVPWFLGKSYLDVPILLCVMSPLCFITGLKGLFGQTYLISTNRSNYSAFATVIGTAINIAVNAILIRPYGAIGAAIASIVSEVCIFIVIIIKIRGELSFKSARADIIRISLAAVIMGVIGYTLSRYSIPSTADVVKIIGICGCLYGITLLIFRVKMVNEIIKSMYSRLRR